MGWGSGTYAAADLYLKVIKPYIPKKDWIDVGTIILNILTDQDWDCVNEVDFFQWIYLENESKNKWKDWDKEEIPELKEELQALRKEFAE